jgi:hypothetical protein
MEKNDKKYLEKIINCKRRGELSRTIVVQKLVGRRLFYRLKMDETRRAGKFEIGKIESYVVK